MAGITAASHRWQTDAVGSSAQMRCVFLPCCAYRVMAKSASRAARIIQMFMRIRASPATLGRFWHSARPLYLRAPARQPSRITGQARAGTLRQCRAVAIFQLLIRVRRIPLFGEPGCASLGGGQYSRNRSTSSIALVSVIPIAPNASSRRRCSSQHSLTGHLNRSIDGVFEIVRVVGRGLISIAEVHAIVARAHCEPKMASD
jgi:hypothetical protein